MSVKEHKNSLSHNTFNNIIDELLVNFGNNEEENISSVEKNEKKISTANHHIHAKSLSKQSKDFQGEFDLESLENILFPHRNANAPNSENGNLIHVNDHENQKQNFDIYDNKEKIKKSSTNNSKRCIVF